MRAWRLPILLVLPALLVGALVVQDRRGSDGSATADVTDAVPMVAPAGSVGSTWYCAAGTATGGADGFAEQTVVIANTGDEDATGQVTAFSDSGNRASMALTVKAHGSAAVRTSDVLRAPWAAMLVEVAGGGIAVSQEVRGSAGRSAGDCSTEPSAAWWFPAGTTRAGSRLTLAMFNPFPGEATVDVSFDTEDGTRTPQQLQGMVVRGGNVAVVDVSAIVTLRERVATSVTLRSGRVVAEMVQSTDGREGTAAGLSMSQGATVSAPVWTFPVATPASVAGREVVAVTNPGDVDVEVQVEVLLDDPARNGVVEPFVASVPARRSITVDLGADPRVPPDVGRWLLVRSLGGEPIVVARSVGAPRSGAIGGLATSIGLPVVATRWVGALPVPSDTSAALLSIVNPSGDRTATVTVEMHTGGAMRTLPSAIDVSLAPGQRLVLDIPKVLGARPDGPFVVTSDVPVVVGQWFTYSTPVDVSTIGSYPVVGTVSFPTTVFTPEVMEFDDLAPRSDDTVPTTTTTTVPETTTTVAASSTTVARN